MPPSMGRCLRILFLTDNFPPEGNAPASRTYEHAREWVRAGHEVTVITTAPNFPEGIVFKGRARVFDAEAGLLDTLANDPGSFNDHDMIIVRYEGSSGAPGMPEMLDSTSRITTLCR